MGAVRKALELPPGAWHHWIDKPLNLLRFLNYPEVRDRSVRMTAHYDHNLRTLLHQSPLHPVSPQGVDSGLGQNSEAFGRKDLFGADGSIPSSRRQDRALSPGNIGRARAEEEAEGRPKKSRTG